jgi:hypothetical protein
LRRDRWLTTTIRARSTSFEAYVPGFAGQDLERLLEQHYVDVLARPFSSAGTLWSRCATLDRCRCSSAGPSSGAQHDFSSRSRDPKVGRVQVVAGAAVALPVGDRARIVGRDPFMPSSTEWEPPRR